MKCPYLKTTINKIQTHGYGSSIRPIIDKIIESFENCIGKDCVAYYTIKKEQSPGLPLVDIRKCKRVEGE